MLQPVDQEATLPPISTDLAAASVVRLAGGRQQPRTCHSLLIWAFYATACGRRMAQVVGMELTDQGKQRFITEAAKLARLPQLS